LPELRVLNADHLNVAHRNRSAFVDIRLPARQSDRSARISTELTRLASRAFAMQGRGRGLCSNSGTASGSR
jgi:hypothetical protein